MAMPWDQRFFTSTRGQIVLLLRRAQRTVDELAEVLGLSDNAVRAHLAALERDGLVQQQGVRRGVSKPAYAYDLTPAADGLFPKAYALVLTQLLAVLAEQLPPDRLDELLVAVGRRLALGHRPEGDMRTRLDAAAGLLGQLGGLAEVQVHDGAWLLRGYSCPLSSVAADQPAVCQLAEALLTEVVGAPVHARCDRGERPRCLFAVAAEDGAGAREGD